MMLKMFSPVVVLGLALSPVVHAQTAYKFKTKTVEAPEVDKTEAPKEEQPAEIEASVAVRQLKTVMGYPKAKVSLAYSPGFLGSKQTLTTAPTGTPSFNLVGTVLTDFSGSVSVDVTPRINVDVAAHYFPISVGGDTTTSALYIIEESSASMIPVTLAGSYCFFYDNWAGKLCPGVSVGIEGFPIYTGANTLTLGTMTDMTVGARVASENPLLLNLLLRSLVSFEYGLKTGQTANIDLTKDMKFWALAEGEFAMNSAFALTLGAVAEYRIANFSTGANVWETTALNYAARLGVRYNFGSKQTF